MKKFLFLLTFLVSVSVTFAAVGDTTGQAVGGGGAGITRLIPVWIDSTQVGSGSLSLPPSAIGTQPLQTISGINLVLRSGDGSGGGEITSIQASDKSTAFEIHDDDIKVRKILRPENVGAVADSHFRINLPSTNTDFRVRDETRSRDVFIYDVSTGQQLFTGQEIFIGPGGGNYVRFTPGLMNALGNLTINTNATRTLTLEGNNGTGSILFAGSGAELLKDIFPRVQGVAAGRPTTSNSFQEAFFKAAGLFDSVRADNNIPTMTVKLEVTDSTGLDTYDNYITGEVAEQSGNYPGYSALNIGGRGSGNPALGFTGRKGFYEIVEIGDPTSGIAAVGDVRFQSGISYPGSPGLELAGIVRPDYVGAVVRANASLGDPLLTNGGFPASWFRIFSEKFSAHDTQDVRIGPETLQGATSTDVLIEDESDTPRIRVEGASGNVTVQSTEALTTGTVQTTDATVTTLKSHTTTTDRAYLVKARIIGRQSSGATDSAMYEITAHVENVSGTVTVIAQPATSSEDDASWDAVLDGSGADLRVRVTGDAAETVEWKCDLEILESD